MSDRDPSAPVAVTPPTPGPLWRRLAAWLVDLAVLAPLLALLAWVWVGLFRLELPSERLPFYDYLVQLYLKDDPMVVGGALFLAGIATAYFLIAPLLFSATLGLRLLGLGLVQGNGRALGPAAATVRALGALLSAAYLGLGFLWIVFDPQRQGFHDKIAGTFVVRRNAR